MVLNTHANQNYMQHYDGVPPVYVFLGCGVVSSSCGQLASFPLALLRTRMQVRICLRLAFNLRQVTDRQTTMMAEFRAVVNQGGPLALYRGILPNYLKVVPAVSIS